MNFIKFGLHSKLEQKEFISTRKHWKTLGLEELRSVIKLEEGRLAFRHWCNRVMEPTYGDIRRLEDNLRVLKRHKHTYII